MIHGESYKPIVAEAAKKAVGEGNVYERIFVSHLLKDADLTVAYHLDEIDGIRPSHANAPLKCKADLESVLEAVRGAG